MADKILVVEDEPALLKAYGRILGTQGWRVVMCEDAERALAVLREEEVDLIVCDIGLPGINGMELLRQLRAGRPDVPVVLVTGAPDTDSAIEAVEYGAFRYLTKPVDSLRLLAAIDSLAASDQAASGTVDRVTDITKHPRFQSDAQPIVDFRALEELEALGEGSTFVAEVINDFIVDAEQVVADIRAAAAADDMAGFRDGLHALRSSAANVGAVRLHRACSGVDQRAATDLPNEGAAQARRIEEEFTRFRSTATRYLAERHEHSHPS